MFERFKRGWQLTKASFRVLKHDKEILVLPVLAFVSIALGLGFWGLVGAATIGLPAGQTTVPHYVLLFLMYVTSAFGGTFFLAATIEMASIRLEGGDPVVRDGLAKAWEKKTKLLGWAVIAATVGILLRVLRHRGKGLARLLAAGLELGWAVATFFAVPVLVYRDMGPIGAIKESGGLMRQTWGEAAGGVGSAGIVFLLLGLLGLIPVVLGFLAGSVTILLVGIAVAVAYWIVLAAANTAVDGILKAALYRFADTGELPSGFEAADPGRVAQTANA
jgi:hypothetical protein